MEDSTTDSPVAKIALIIEYEGTRYKGFQLQKGSPTVQGEIESALWRLTGEKTRIAGASRTDSGVHALGQMVSFRTKSSLSSQTFVRGLNYYLPKDIAVKAACQIQDDQDVRRNALSREYRYTIVNSETPSPLHRRYAYHVTHALDVKAMDQASQTLVGKHDFASFSGAEERAKSRVRIVSKAEVRRTEGLVLFDMTANSFLYQQVRRTVGALLRVGMGKMECDEFRKMVERKQVGLAGPTAPPHGLCLIKINYPNGYILCESENENL